MIIPIRCFTCGKVLANKWNAYQKRVKELEAELDTEAEAEAETKSKDASVELHPLFDSKLKGKILFDLGITKMCCKRHMLTHVDIIDYL